MQSVTVAQAVEAVRRAGGGPVLARELIMGHGSMQGLSNALRHAYHQGYLDRRIDRENSHRYLWSIRK
jgi:hypothetical protein